MINKSNICPECGKTPQIDNAHRKTCVNTDCDNYNLTYLHYEWHALHDSKISVGGQINKLMRAFP